MIKLGAAHDIPEGSSRIYVIQGEEIAVFNVDGKFFALSNICPHQGGPLGEGEIEGGTITCPWHGWKFDIKTGGCLQGDEDCKRYEVIEEKGVLYLKTTTPHAH